MKPDEVSRRAFPVVVVLCLSACGGPPDTPVAAEVRAPPPASIEPPSPVSSDPRQHAIVIVIDTLRADAVDRAATPHLDALAAAGDDVPHAWSAGTWTVPSIVSLLTGMSVREHGWDLASAQIGKYPPLPDAPMLAEVLKESGFHTAGLYANPYLAEKLGFDRGFDRWQRSGDEAMANRVAKEVATWKPGERHFLYVHLIGPHSALDPSPEARKRYALDPKWFDARIGFDIGAAKRDRREGVREAYREAYHAVVEDTDARVGEILEVLEPHLDDSVLVLTSDHGELLGEHDVFGHGTHVWQQLTHVPLIAVGAGDLPDTLGIAAIPDVITTSLGLRHAWSVRRDDALPLVAQREGRVAMSTDGRIRGVWRKSDFAVYDVSKDPTETKPLTGRGAELRAARVRWEAEVPAGTTSMERVELSDETQKELEALGYVE